MFGFTHLHRILNATEHSFTVIWIYKSVSYEEIQNHERTCEYHLFWI